MRKLLVSVGLTIIVVSSPAAACMANGPAGFTHGLIWENPQSQVPHDSIRLKVRHVGQSNAIWGFSAKVLDGPTKMVGRTYRFVDEASHSCVGLGASEGYLVVRKIPVDAKGTKEGTFVKALAAIEYEPSWLNELLRFFGGANWQYPGNRGPGQRSIND